MLMPVGGHTCAVLGVRNLGEGFPGLLSGCEVVCAGACLVPHGPGWAMKGPQVPTHEEFAIHTVLSSAHGTNSRWPG